MILRLDFSDQEILVPEPIDSKMKIARMGRGGERRGTGDEMKSIELTTSRLGSDKGAHNFHHGRARGGMSYRRSRWSLLDGYDEEEPAACAGDAVHPDAAPVQLHETFDDGQPQPRAARISAG